MIDKNNDIICCIRKNTEEDCKTALYELNEYIQQMNRANKKNRTNQSSSLALCSFAVGVLCICGNLSYPIDFRRLWAINALQDATDNATGNLYSQAEKLQNALQDGMDFEQCKRKFFPNYPLDFANCLSDCFCSCQK